MNNNEKNKKVVIVTNSILASEKLSSTFINNNYDVNIISNNKLKINGATSFECNTNDVNILNSIFEKIDRIDCLIIFPSSYLPKNITETTEREFDFYSDLIIKHTYNAIKYSINKIRKNNGNIIILHSSVAINAEPGATIYSMLQSTLIMLCKSLAIREGKNSVRVNNIALGPAQTDELMKIVTEEQISEWKKINPLGVSFDFDDFLNIIFDLANGTGAYSKMTGSIITIDGGESIADAYSVTQKEDDIL